MYRLCFLRNHWLTVLNTFACFVAPYRAVNPAYGDCQRLSVKVYSCSSCVMLVVPSVKAVGLYRATLGVDY